MCVYIFVHMRRCAHTHTDTRRHHVQCMNACMSHVRMRSVIPSILPLSAFSAACMHTCMHACIHSYIRMQTDTYDLVYLDLERLLVCRHSHVSRFGGNNHRRNLRGEMALLNRGDGTPVSLLHVRILIVARNAVVLGALFRTDPHLRQMAPCQSGSVRARRDCANGPFGGMGMRLLTVAIDNTAGRSVHLKYMGIRLHDDRHTGPTGRRGQDSPPFCRFRTDSRQIAPSRLNRARCSSTPCRLPRLCRSCPQLSPSRPSIPSSCLRRRPCSQWSQRSTAAAPRPSKPAAPAPGRRRPGTRCRRAPPERTPGDSWRPRVRP